MRRRTHEQPASPAALALRAYLQTPEGQDKLQALLAKGDAQRAAQVAYFESADFRRTYAELPQIIKSYPLDELAMERRLWAFYDCLRQCYEQDLHPEIEQVEVAANDFGGLGYRYRDYILSPAHGQGSLMCLYYAPSTAYQVDCPRLNEELHFLDHLS